MRAGVEINLNKMSKKIIGDLKGITLRERLLLEIAYFKETGDHLDINNWTLCSGSRSSDGSVPYVRWYPDDGEVRVYWYCSGDRYSRLRSRQAQFLKPVPSAPLSLEHQCQYRAKLEKIKDLLK